MLAGRTMAKNRQSFARNNRCFRGETIPTAAISVLSPSVWRFGCSFGGSEPIVSPRINYHLLSGCWLLLCRQSAKPRRGATRRSGKRGKMLKREKDARRRARFALRGSTRETKAASIVTIMAADVETVAVFPRRSSTMLLGCTKIDRCFISFEVI